MIREIMHAQDNCCAICNASFTFETSYVDIKSGSKEIRGLLCISCDSALHNFKDDPELIQKAIEYLKKGETHAT